MHVLHNKKTKEVGAYKYLTPELNKVFGYSEQHFRRLASDNKSIEDDNYIVYFNCYFKEGNKRYNGNPEIYKEGKKYIY